MKIDLTGKVAVVFGAGRAQAIGAHTARMLADCGAQVVVADIAADLAVTTADTINLGGGRAIGMAVDISDEAQVRAVIDAAKAEFGAINILFNNAAAVHLAATDGAAANVDVNLWQKTFNINTMGIWLACKYAIPMMIEAGGGSIINTSSGSSLLGELNLTAYAASKAAVNQLTRSIATQYGKQGIRCNSVLPGMILTQNAMITPELIAKYQRHHLTPYVGHPNDIAYMVSFLASDAARFVTAQNISVDGGITAHTGMFAEEWDARIATNG